MVNRGLAVAVLRAGLVGFAYYVGAYLGVTQTITPEGIAILWPPNAVLLAAFLILPPRQWPLPALAAVVAELVADTPQFPLWAALAFAFINLFETLMAAWLIRLAGDEHRVFARLRSATSFLLFGPGLASAAAALFGAYVYTVLDSGGSTYWALWRIWWFGDALGLLLLTPLIVLTLRTLVKGLRPIHWPQAAELFFVWMLLIYFGSHVFTRTAVPGQEFSLTPIVLLPLCAWVAVRMSVTKAALTVTLVGAMAVWHMVRGEYPYPGITPQHTVWMMQEFLTVVAILSIGLAVLMNEIRQQRRMLNQHERMAMDTLQRQNELLEARVAERTHRLQQINAALEEANRRLEYLASTDALTGVNNRRYFRDIAQREMKRCVQAGIPLSLIMFDIDGFKYFNDTYGHDTGDRVLSHVVSTCNGVIRPLDRVGRFGGEEFLILLPDTDIDTACEVAERMRNAIAARELEDRGRRLSVTASFGVTQWDGRCAFEGLVKTVDNALYAAKEAGRNQVRMAVCTSC